MAEELLTVIVVSVSSTAFCLVMVTVLVVLCKKEPTCCRFTQQPEDYQEDVFQYCSSQSLIGHSDCPAMIHRTPGNQHPGGLFVVGKPDHYHLAGPLPRLPSYESVRKKDRQRHIHSLIAQRFGLGLLSEPPPSYDESVRHSADVSTVDLHSLDAELSTQTFGHPSDLNQDNQRGSPTAELYTDPYRLSLHSEGSVRV